MVDLLYKHSYPRFLGDNCIFAIIRESTSTVMHDTAIVIGNIQGVDLSSRVFVKVVTVPCDRKEI